MFDPLWNQAVRFCDVTKSTPLPRLWLTAAAFQHTPALAHERAVNHSPRVIVDTLTGALSMSIMASAIVLRCNKEHSSHLNVPKSEPLKMQWLSFVFEAICPKDWRGDSLTGIPHDRLCFPVCVNHFTSDSVTNEKKRIGTNVLLLNLQKMWV